MFPKLTQLLCLVALAYAVPRRLPRLAGGQDAKPGQYPYYVSLYYKSSISVHPISFCGGAILNDQWILTAGYCVSSVQNPSELVVKAGNIYYAKFAETEQMPDVAASFIHSQYTDALGPHDIGLLKLKTPLKFNEFVAPIDLNEAEEIPSGEATIVGLGSLKSLMSAYFPESLQTLTVSIIDNEECKKAINDEVADALVDEYRFCTGATDSYKGYCLHDTGDPLAINENGKDVLVGLATFGFAADCETPGLPSIYTRLSAHNDWIKETISKN